MRRRIFLPMTRVTAIDSGQVITTGVVNMRRFEQRPTETLVLGEMLDRRVTPRARAARRSPSSTSAMEQDRHAATGRSPSVRAQGPAAGSGAAARR